MNISTRHYVSLPPNWLVCSSTSSYFLNSAMVVTAFSFTTSHSGNDVGKSLSLTSVSTQCRHSSNIHGYHNTLLSGTVIDSINVVWVLFLATVVSCAEIMFSCRDCIITYYTSTSHGLLLTQDQFLTAMSVLCTRLCSAYIQ